jgi:hypothetical protein
MGAVQSILPAISYTRQVGYRSNIIYSSNSMLLNVQHTKEQEVRTLYEGKIAHRIHYIVMTEQTSAKAPSDSCLSCADQLLPEY